MKKMILKVLFVVSFSLSFAFAETWGPNDISILLPLPAQESESQDLITTQSIQGQNLLPFFLFNESDQLESTMSNQDLYDKYLSVVSLRVDPCFFEGKGPLSCTRQIRLVWQPVLKEEGTTEFTTRDAAVHTSFQIEEGAWKNFLEDFKKLPKTPGVPALGIHPIIAQETLKGVYWSELKKLVFKYCDKSNLKRVTFLMLIGTTQSEWMFRGIDVVNGKAVTHIIPGVHKFEQIFSQQGGAQEILLARITAEIFNPLNISWLSIISDTKAYLKYQNPSEDELRLALKSAYKVENPDMHNIGTMDCLSCHTTHLATNWIAENYKQYDLDPKNYTSNFYVHAPVAKVDPELMDTTKVMRAFGYFKHHPFVSQRTVNETQKSLGLFE